MAIQNNDTLAFEIMGKLEKSDYLEILHPMIDKAANESKKLKVLMHFGPEFDGFSPAAAWEDFKLGIHHWKTFEKIAVVTDLHWLTNTVRLFGSMMPGEVKTFENSQLEEAASWLD